MIPLKGTEVMRLLLNIIKGTAVHLQNKYHVYSWIVIILFLPLTIPCLYTVVQARAYIIQGMY